MAELETIAKLLMPRKQAIRLLYAAQNSDGQPVRAVVGSDSLHLLRQDGGTLAEALQAPGLQPWAVFEFGAGVPEVPRPADFAGAASLLRLTASLETRGVLQLHAWSLVEGQVVERDLDIRD